MNPLKDCRVLVTPTSYAMYDSTLRTDLETQVGEVIYNTLGRPLTEADLLENIASFDGVIAGLDDFSATVINAGERLRVIARYGVGVDRVDLSAAQQRGVIVTNTPGANASSVAELAVGLMLALARSIPYANNQTKSGGWPRLKGRTLSGRTIGLLGLGAIGSKTAQMLRGFNCRVIGYDPALSVEQAAALGVEWLPQADVLAQADFLSLHLPVLPATRELLNAATFAQMKDGAFLINTARSELIAEQALLDALADGTLAGAALDAFWQEPPGADNPLLHMEQVIVTPHTGSHTDRSTNRMGRMALDDCLAVLKGDKPLHRVV